MKSKKKIKTNESIYLLIFLVNNNESPMMKGKKKIKNQQINFGPDLALEPTTRLQ
jgi:hypothetical protein